MNVLNAIDGDKFYILFKFKENEIKWREGTGAIEWECDLEALESFIAEEKEEQQPQYGS